MTPKEKAIELVNRYQTSQNNLLGVYWDGVSKQHALIAVDEILNEYENKGTLGSFVDYQIPYWQEVKQEIEKL